MTGRAVVPRKTKPLSDRQRLFVDEYMKDRNATQAYIRAGYSPKGADGHAARLVGNGSVAAEIAKRVELYSASAGLQVVDVLERLKAIAWTDVRKIISKDGGVLPVEQWPDDVVIGGMDVSAEFEKNEDGVPIHVGWTKKIKLWEQVPALRLLLEHLKGGPGPTVNINQTNNTLVVQQAGDLMSALGWVGKTKPVN